MPACHATSSKLLMPCICIVTSSHATYAALLFLPPLHKDGIHELTHICPNVAYIYRMHGCMHAMASIPASASHSLSFMAMTHTHVFALSTHHRGCSCMRAIPSHNWNASHANVTRCFLPDGNGLQAGHQPCFATGQEAGHAMLPCASKAATCSHAMCHASHTPASNAWPLPLLEDDAMPHAMPCYTFYQTWMDEELFEEKMLHAMPKWKCSPCAASFLLPSHDHTHR